VANRPLASLATDGGAREGHTSFVRLEADANRATARWEAAWLHDEFEGGGGGPLPKRSRREGMRGRRASAVPRWAHGEGRWREKRCHITCCLRPARLDSMPVASEDHLFSRAQTICSQEHRPSVLKSTDHLFSSAQTYMHSVSRRAHEQTPASGAVLIVHLFFLSPVRDREL